MKTNYRNFTIEKTNNGFLCEFINCFACRTQEQVERAIDRYLDGDKKARNQGPEYVSGPGGRLTLPR